MPASLAARAAALLLAGAFLAACSENEPAPWQTGQRCWESAPPGTVAEPIRRGPACSMLGEVGCIVQGIDNLLDNTFSTVASIQYPLGLFDALLGGAAGIALHFPGTMPPGTHAAFEVGVPRGLLRLSLAQHITISTTMNGEVVESERHRDLVVDAIGIPVSGARQREMLGFEATEPFNGVEITLSAGVLGLDISPGITVLGYCARPIAD